MASHNRNYKPEDILFPNQVITESHLVEEMEKTAVDPANQTIFISHGDCEEDVNLVADEIRKRFGTKDIHINYVGPVIGSHTGAGIVALFFLGTKR